MYSMPERFDAEKRTEAEALVTGNGPQQENLHLERRAA